MSISASLGEYRAALTTPGVRGPVVAALFGRMPIAMVGFSLLLFIQRVTDSYAAAGAVSAAVLAGVAVGAVVQGRVIDRIGPTRPLLVTPAVFAVLVTAMIVAVERRGPTALLVPLAAVLGLSQPSIGSTARAMWTRLLPPGPVRNAGMTYEAIITEVYFIVGPALAGVLLAAPWPGTGVVVSAGMMVGGCVWYALTTTMRHFRPEPGRLRSRRLLGALASPGLRTVTLAAVGMGIVIGFVEVATVAAANRAGHPSAGGVLVGLWAVSSAVFGVFYGIRPWPRPLRLRIPVLLMGFALLVAPMAIPRSLPALGVFLLIAGTVIAPQVTAHSEVIELVAIDGLLTESFAWVITSATLGIGVGQAASGEVIERIGLGASYLVAGAVGLVLAGVVQLRASTVVDPAPAHDVRLAA